MLILLNVPTRCKLKKNQMNEKEKHLCFSVMFRGGELKKAPKQCKVNPSPLPQLLLQN